MRKNLTIFKIKRFKSFFGTRLYCSSVLAIVELLKKDFEQKRPPSLIRIASVIFLLSRITDVFLLQFPEKLLCKKKFCRFLSWFPKQMSPVKKLKWIGGEHVTLKPQCLKIPQNCLIKFIFVWKTQIIGFVVLTFIFVYAFLFLFCAAKFLLISFYLFSYHKLQDLKRIPKNSWCWKKNFGRVF